MLRPGWLWNRPRRASQPSGTCCNTCWAGNPEGSTTTPKADLNITDLIRYVFSSLQPQCKHTCRATADAVGTPGAG
jgi:hypothetical protein